MRNRTQQDDTRVRTSSLVRTTRNTHIYIIICAVGSDRGRPVGYTVFLIGHAHFKIVLKNMMRTRRYIKQLDSQLPTRRYGRT